jgi:purine-binding chemotaxis protein CheW
MDETLHDLQVASFRLGHDIYAVDIMRIKEIIRPQKLVTLPRSPSFVEGIINLRGKIVPVIDIGKRFNLPRSFNGSTTCLLIVTIGQRLVGLVVDEMTGVISFPVRDLKPSPEVMDGIRAEYLVGVCLVDDSLVMLLNPDALLSGEETTELGMMARDTQA